MDDKFKKDLIEVLDDRFKANFETSFKTSFNRLFEPNFIRLFNQGVDELILPVMERMENDLRDEFNRRFDQLDRRLDQMTAKTQDHEVRIKNLELSSVS